MSSERKRKKNAGVRKLCGCAWRTWPKCSHPWHFNFKFNGEHFRFSLDRRIEKIVRVERTLPNGQKKLEWRRDRATLGRQIASKTEAQHEAERLRVAIKDGSILEGGVDRPNRETLTLSQLMDTYRSRYLEAKRPQSLRHLNYQIPTILRTNLERLDGGTRAFRDWLVVDITADTIEQFHRARTNGGAPIAANRDLQLLRAMFNWAVGRDHIERTPFKKGAVTVVKLARETKRRRRLRPGEGERLLAACGVHLRAVVEAAIETGMRRGEILSLQWNQVRFEPKAEIFLPAAKTKTKADRTIPVSSRLRAILEMRRYDPAGEEHPGTAYVFGNEIGQQVKNVKRAWQRALLKAHGFVPRYVTRTVQEGKRRRKIRTAMLTPECLAALEQIDLHFHDLRREAGSRWLDGGVPLHRIKQWLGHANISQTSTYLEAEAADNDEAMRRYEERLQRIATGSETGGQTVPSDSAIVNTNPQKAAESRH